EVLRGEKGDHIPLDSDISANIVNDPSRENACKGKRKVDEGPFPGNSAGSGNRRRTQPVVTEGREPRAAAVPVAARMGRRKKGGEDVKDAPSIETGGGHRSSKGKRRAPAGCAHGTARAGMSMGGRGRGAAGVCIPHPEKEDGRGALVETGGQDEVVIKYLPYSPPLTRRSAGRGEHPRGRLRRCLFSLRGSQGGEASGRKAPKPGNEGSGGRGGASCRERWRICRRNESGDEHSRDPASVWGIGRGYAVPATSW
ncbi:hypothetical protein M758_4G095900, partial [Ceratodon purpureus]